MLPAGCNEDNPAQPDPDNSWALSFDGVDDLVFVPDTPALDVTGSFTLGLWYYFPGGVTGEPGLVQKDGPGSFGRYGLWVVGNKVDFCVYIDSASQSCLVSTGSLTLNAWNHVAGVYDGATMKIYLNGALDSSQNLSGAVSVSSEPLYIGVDPTEPAFSPGRIQEVQVWSVARTEQEIKTGMDQQPVGNEPGLVCYLRMNEGAGQTLNDLSASDADGVRGTTAATEASDPAWSKAPWPH
jgi:hypothetical protein